MMNLSFKTLAIHVCLLLPMLAYSAPQHNLPAQLMYQGKPIDPLCLFNLESTKAVVDLRRCGLDSKAGYVISGKNKQLISQGFMGYDYGGKINDSANLSGYSYYKSLGTVGHSVIVQTINNSGGTGSFSFLNLIKRDGNTLKLSVINGGDRCNGGLVDVKRVGTGTSDRIIYKIHLTPYDFFTRTHDNPHHLKAYEDLSACAVCCAATAVYQRHIGADFADEKLLYVDVSDYLKNIIHSQLPQTDQGCFDTLL